MVESCKLKSKEQLTLFITNKEWDEIIEKTIDSGWIDSKGTFNDRFADYLKEYKKKIK